MSSIKLFRPLKKSLKLRNSLLPLQRNYSSNKDDDTPYKKTVDVFKHDFDHLKHYLLNTENKPKQPRIPHFCDILIIGGGVMGCSIAYWLQQRALDGLDIVVIEKDPTYQKSTSVLSVGGLRQQFSLKENIELSMFSAEFMRNIKYYLGVNGQDPPDIQFNPCGYLFLASEEHAEVLNQNATLQKSLGAKIELLTPENLKRKFPFINTDGIGLGCHGLENEGWFDPWSLLNAFKRKAKSLGTHFVSGEVISFEALNNSDVVPSDEDTHKQLKSVKILTENGEEKEISFSILVIAAGANSGHVAQLAERPLRVDLNLPVEPRKRYVYNVHCPEAPGMVMPFVIDNSGAYVRREGLAGHYLCGMSPSIGDPEPPVDNLDVDFDFFENRVWPAIANRVPCFEGCKLKSGWAGFYDYNKFDENCFVGPHPYAFNVYLATGFSGHGIQQSPAIGRSIMEMIIDGGYMTIDLSRLEYSRLLQDQPLWESNIV
ncbi:FAD-dependent oxidoreductase domain-containing protein 1-like isoform X2 [Cimex lectularius]|uniref:FAD-dependent oxidoreductase domain-containing protein 1 n=1 Tax=Cimex lectularius TaxID=79782 RepID=A0A8I6SCS0_CIMLE|nr:FAD-dependent oxidoreductase domain-containing protein 1-like isoform X2 [Cimex lectularius]